MKEVAGVALVEHSGAMLFQHRDQKPGLAYAGRWSIPSGHKEPGETTEQCARRELLEETGYRCEGLELLSLVQDRDDTNSDYRLSVFWACYDGVQQLKCLEGQSIRFIERASAASYPMPPFILGVWDQALKKLEMHDPKRR